VQIDWVREYCLSKKYVEESLPFGPDVLVFKVGGKLFLLCPLNAESFRFNVKYNAENIDELRAEFSCVYPGFHQSKKHWNTIIPDGSVNLQQLKVWIDHSYDIVLQSLPKKTREQL
jgi:predicted DNA-binding protein (MmcQ/YjbR family)